MIKIKAIQTFLRKSLPDPIVSILYHIKIFLIKNKSFNINKNRKNEEWFSYKEFYDFILENYNFTKFIEVGVWKGHGVCYLAKSLKRRNTKNASVVAIDLFNDVGLYDGTFYEQDANNLLEMFDLNIKEAQVENLVSKIRGNSWKMAKKIKNNSVDLVFIDADHSYESVTKDIGAYLPKVKKGGIISGHDALNKNVISAVHDYFGEGNYKVIESADTWYVSL